MTRSRIVRAFQTAAILVVAIVIVGGAAVMLIPRLPPRVLYWSDISQTRHVIEQIERYRAMHGNYPDPTEFVVPGGMYYELLSPDHYIVGFAPGFDEQYHYDNVTKRWSFEDEPK